MDSRKKKKKSNGLGSQPVLPALEKSEPLCDLHQGRVDNIMDTYLTDYPFDKYARVTKAVSAEEDLPSIRSQCQREPNGFKKQVSVEPSHTTYDLTQRNSEGPIPELDDGFFPYEQYFKQDTQTLKSRLAEEEQVQSESLARKEVDHRRIVPNAASEVRAPMHASHRIIAEEDAEGDEYTYHRRSMLPAGAFKTDTMDLLAYIASGILLIFIMEQFLRIGIYMRM